MTQTRLRQTNWNDGRFPKTLSKTAGVPKTHFWNGNFASEIPSSSLRIRWCCMSLVGNIIICILILGLARFPIVLMAIENTGMNQLKKSPDLMESQGTELVVISLTIFKRVRWSDPAKRTLLSLSSPFNPRPLIFSSWTLAHALQKLRQ